MEVQLEIPKVAKFEGIHISSLRICQRPLPFLLKPNLLCTLNRWPFFHRTLQKVEIFYADFYTVKRKKAFQSAVPPGTAFYKYVCSKHYSTLSL
jgi:hypothetical protein